MENKDKNLEEVIDVRSLSAEKSNDAYFWRVIIDATKKLDALGVETRGIERIQPYERSTNKSKLFISVIGLWISASGGLSSMSTFFLGPLLFGLGLKKTLVPGLVGLTLGCAIAAYCSLMGPRSGCRQMVTARFLFGWWFVKFVSLISIIGVVGWSVVNSVVGGQILVSISNETIPLTVGIIIVAVISLVVAVCGIKQLLKVEALLSIPITFSFIMLYIVSSKKFSYLSNMDSATYVPDSGTARGNWLSFFSLCYSVTGTWGTIASDYYILFPENTPDVQIFFLTFFGILVPSIFVGILAILIGNIALFYEPWMSAYEANGMGGLINEAFKPWGGGGKFLLILIFLSLISNNIINTYSAAFGVQLEARFLSKIPRWIWAIIITGVYLTSALVGRNQFSTILGNFLPMVGYWVSMYFIMLLEENTIFRTDRFVHLYTKEFPNGQRETNEKLITAELRLNQHYNFNIWNDYANLSYGIASTSSFICGIAGVVLGMSQTYWVGPVAKKMGGIYGGDIAMWLCMGISGLVFPVLRYFELKRFGR